MITTAFGPGLPCKTAGLGLTKQKPLKSCFSNFWLHLSSCISGSTASLDSLSSSAGSGVLSMYVVPICSPICPLCHASVLLRADGVPIVLRICKGRAFEHGPFSLGRWYLPIGITALAWVVVSTVRTSGPCISVTGLHPRHLVLKTWFV